MDVLCAPEIGVLYVLQHTLSAARLMLLTQNPEICDPELERAAVEPHARRVRALVLALLDRIDELAQLLTAYRRALRQLRAAVAREHIPF